LKDSENKSPENNDLWNKREQKSPLAQYLLLALLCLILAYLLSGSVN